MKHKYISQDLYSEICNKLNNIIIECDTERENLNIETDYRRWIELQIIVLEIMTFKSNLIEKVIFNEKEN